MDEAEARAAAPPTRYRAFISYSHTDSRIAGWLHRKLEGWKLADGTRLAPIFIDQAELAAGPDLSASVRDALRHSAALIVVASPSARASQWVAQEIALFRELHPDRPVLAALAAGEPGDAFPEALLVHEGSAIEPLAADLREGRDGKRLALLKLVAGLTRQPLDRLIQRDAQSRQRRVMGITAGALLLSLVLAGLLVLALRARAEAERQRADAEGMVEFMLTDLRDKLKGVGRLDVMDAVNERAMKHYAGGSDALTDEETLRRARLIQTMGSDDLERAGVDPAKAAVRQRARTEFEQAEKLTRTLLQRRPTDPDVLFAAGQSEFYLGMLSFTPRESNGPRDLVQTRLHWQRYLDLAHQLVRLQPGNAKWIRELGFAEGSMCSLALQAGQNPSEALNACQAASQTMGALYARDASSLQAGIEFANRLGWEADAALAAGRGERAAQLRRQQVAITERLAQQNRDDARALKANMLSQLGAAKLFIALSRKSEAAAAIAEASSLAHQLAAIDPENSDWQARIKQIDALKLTLN